MTLPAKALSDIQKAGTAVASANAHTKAAVAALAKKASDAMVSGHEVTVTEGLVAKWKQLMELGSEIQALEASARDIYHRAASIISASDAPASKGAAKAPKPAKAAKVAKVAAKAKGKPGPKTKLVTPTPAAASEASAAAPVVAATVAAPAKATKAAKATKTVVKSAKAVSKTSVKSAAPAPAPSAPKAAKKASKATAKSATKATTTAPAAAPADPAPVSAAEPAPQATVAKKDTKPSRISEFLAKNKSVQPRPALSGNPHKLMTYLDTKLNKEVFQSVNQTEAAKETGIPTGSVNAALKKVVSSGYVVAGEGGYKLVG